MAQRDRSQGFGFMYVDISKLLKQRDELTKDDSVPFSTENVVTANFNKDRQTPSTSSSSVATPTPAATSSAVPAAAVDRPTAIKQIKDNLDRLQALHHKLHAMLEELNKVADKRPKSN